MAGTEGRRTEQMKGNEKLNTTPIKTTIKVRVKMRETMLILRIGNVHPIPAQDRPRVTRPEFTVSSPHKWTPPCQSVPEW
jgi:hypothetical protein